MPGLAISPDLTLPVDAATGTFGILATKGAGKSNAAVVMAEEMYDAGIPWVAVDPKGDWWGIRSSADGRGPGLPIVVFGGRHGDIPLEPTAGALIADLVLTKRLTCVLDVSQFTKADITRFLLAFGRHLFIHADDDGPEPLHLLLEEAHEYLPQVVRGDQAHLVEAWQRIVKQGRFKGLGCTLISQRSSALNKDVLELIDTLVVLQTIGPRSRKSIEDWVKDQDVDQALVESLPSLAKGEAWVWSPGELQIMQRIRFRRRRTFDSGATPKVGQKRREPSTLADIDLGELKERMAETIEKVKADDPRELRKRIRDLEKQLAAKSTAEPVVERVEVSVLDVELVERIEEILGRADDIGATFKHEAAELSDRLTAATARPAVAAPGPSPARPAASRPASAAPRPTSTSGGDLQLGKAERAVLTVLAQFPVGRSKTQVALLSGYSVKSSSLSNALGALRSAGYATKGNPIQATPEGIAALGEVEPLPTGPELLEHWKSGLGKAERLCLDAFVTTWPGELTKEVIAEITCYSASSSSLSNALGRLRSLELVDGWRASDDLMAAIQ